MPRVLARALSLAAVLMALGLGMGVRWQALSAGFWSDDYLHHAMLARVYPVQRAAWDLFGFSRGGEDETRRLVGYGYYPWWTHEDFRLSMLRPLASLSHAFDYQTFGLDAHAHHLHSLLWWALALLAAAALLFAVLPRAAAAVAVLLFALDESHTVPLVWLSNRSLLMATAFGAAALWQHVQFRRGGWRGARAASIGLFGLALLSGEYALPMFGYLASFELFSRLDPATRARALRPPFALALGFIVLWAVLGYGTAHSGLYTNPLESPLAYVRKLGAGIPVLLGELVLGVPADYFSFAPPSAIASWHALQVGMGALAIVLALVTLGWLTRRLEPGHALALRWLIAGAVIGLLPVLGAFVTSRLALPASIGFAALFGSALWQAALALRRAVRARAPAAALGLLAVGLAVLYVHGYRAARISFESTALYTHAAVSRTFWPMTAEIDDAEIAGQQIVMVAAADANDAPYLPFVRFAHGRPLARGFRLLSGSPAGHLLKRIDAQTLELTLLDPHGLENSVAGSLARGRNERLRPGFYFELPGLRVEVLATQGGQPIQLRYRFDVALEDASLLWLESTPAGLRRLALPLPGQARALAAPTMPDAAPGPRR